MTDFCGTYMQRLVYVPKVVQDTAIACHGHSHCMVFPHDRSKTVCSATLQQKQKDDGDLC